MRYGSSKAVTANEIHIPVGVPVQVVGTTADVIHSFWIPQLNRKIDLIPGRPNRLLLDADQAGTYEGQCAEFCGLQHAHMTATVVAQPPAAFRAWLANMAKPARAGDRAGEARASGLPVTAVLGLPPFARLGREQRRRPGPHASPDARDARSGNDSDRRVSVELQRGEEVKLRQRAAVATPSAASRSP